MSTSLDEFSLAIAGATIMPKHFDASLKLIHSAHNDAIGAPKVLYNNNIEFFINAHHFSYLMLVGRM